MARGERRGRRRRHRLPLRPDEKQGGCGTAGAAPTRARGRREERAAARQRRARRRPRHRPRREPREGSRQSSAERLHADLSRGPGAGTREALPHEGDGARSGRHGKAWHGRAAVGGARQRPAAQIDRARASRRGESAKAGGAGGQRHHLRHRRHLAQARARDGRNEVRHVRRGERARHAQGSG
ncbi:hypothetical protein D3C83_03970 [compost metagenome]